MAGIFKNILNTVKKAGKDIAKQTVRSAHDVGRAVDSPIGKVVLGVAVGLGTFGIGTAAAIGATAGAIKPGGNLRTTATGAATGAAAGAAGKLVRSAVPLVKRGLGGLKGTLLKPTAPTAPIEPTDKPLTITRRAEPLNGSAGEAERSAAFHKAIQPVDEIDRQGRIKFGRSWQRTPEQVNMLNWNREGSKMEGPTMASGMAELPAMTTTALRDGPSLETGAEPWYQKPWLWIIAAVVLVALLFVATRGGSK